jgi:hypothetical protein
VRVRVGALVAIIMLSGCQEKLTSPGDCPALCPGGEPQVFDEVFSPIIGADSSFRGYIQPFAAPSLLISNGLQGSEERGIVRFVRRADSVGVRDTLRAYTIDSVAFGFSIVARDTTLTGLQVQLYRLPATIDSTTTFASVDPFFVPGNLVTTIAVADTLKRGSIRTVLQGADLARVVIPAADTGVLALGIRIDAPVPTGVRLGAINGASPAAFSTYATLDVPDTGAAKLRTLSVVAGFNSSLPAVSVVDDSTLLAVGGAPSARTLLRFDLPARILDSATIVRATLELTAVGPITGLATDPARMQARAVLADLGAKSPLNSTAGRVPADTIESGVSGTIDLEAVRLVELWLGASTSPSALVLSLAPDLEGASFSQPVFFSTRAADPAVRPRLRISYLRSFPFENP